MYKLTYYDNRLQQQVEHIIDAETECQARNRANKILSSKDFTKPLLEEVKK